MRSICSVFALLLMANPRLQAQLYTDVSTTNLPRPGATGPSMDVRAADLDGDGDLDLVLAREFQPNAILRNNGRGVFTNWTPGNLPQPIRDSEDVAIADFNRDGVLDIVFCSEDDLGRGGTNVHEYYLGKGGGRFEAAPFLLPDSEANAVITAYLNKDSIPDLLFGNNGFNFALIGKGDGSFTAENERIPPFNRITQDLTLADVDRDGDADLLESNENGNLLHLNDGMGNFINVNATHLPATPPMESRKAAFGDVNADGYLDLFVANVRFTQGQDPQNRLYLNDKTGKFIDVTTERLPADADNSIDAIFEDVDLDEDLDLVIANVFGGPIKVYENYNNGFFRDATQAVLGQSYVRDALGVIAADLNGDGLRDLYICDRVSPQSTRRDILLLRKPAVVSTSEEPNAPATAIIYPNPVKDHFYVKTSAKHTDSVYIENLQGQTLALLPLSSAGEDVGYCKVAGANLASGVYVVRVGGVRKKIIVQQQ